MMTEYRPPVSRRVPLKDITNTVSYVEPIVVVSDNSVVFSAPARRTSSHVVEVSSASSISQEEIEKIRMKKRKQLKRL
jgi:hypothetical protein